MLNIKNLDAYMTSKNYSEMSPDEILKATGLDDLKALENTVKTNTNQTKQVVSNTTREAIKNKPKNPLDKTGYVIAGTGLLVGAGLGAKYLYDRSIEGVASRQTTSNYMHKNIRAFKYVGDINNFAVAETGLATKLGLPTIRGVIGNIIKKRKDQKTKGELLQIFQEIKNTSKTVGENIGKGVAVGSLAIGGTLLGGKLAYDYLKPKEEQINTNN